MKNQNNEITDDQSGKQLFKLNVMTGGANVTDVSYPKIIRAYNSDNAQSQPVASHGVPVHTPKWCTFCVFVDAIHVLCGDHTCAARPPYICCVETMRMLPGHHT